MSSDPFVTGTDGTATAKLAVNRAAELARALGARLHVVTAYSSNSSGPGWQAPQASRWSTPQITRAHSGPRRNRRPNVRAAQKPITCLAAHGRQSPNGDQPGKPRDLVDRPRLAHNRERARTQAVAGDHLRRRSWTGPRSLIAISSSSSASTSPWTRPVPR